MTHFLTWLAAHLRRCLKKSSASVNYKRACLGTVATIGPEGLNLNLTTWAGALSSRCHLYSGVAQQLHHVLDT